MYKVIDKLPSTCYNVLAYDANGVFLGLVSYDFKKWWQERKELDNVAYWTAIPTPKLDDCGGTGFVADITVVDPNTLDTVRVELRKEYTTGKIVGIDTRALEAGQIIYSPYVKDEVLDFLSDD